MANNTPISQLSVLPARPSALLRVAIADAKKIFADPRYLLNMGAWHQPPGYGGSDKCEVCFAGAAIANSLRKDPGEYCVPTGALGADEGKLLALDTIRHGDVAHFVRQVIGRYLSADEAAQLNTVLPPGGRVVVDAPRAGTKGVKFLRDMAKIATKLESIGW